MALWALGSPICFGYRREFYCQVFYSVGVDDPDAAQTEDASAEETKQRNTEEEEEEEEDDAGNDSSKTEEKESKSGRFLCHLSLMRFTEDNLIDG